MIATFNLRPWTFVEILNLRKVSKFQTNQRVKRNVERTFDVAFDASMMNQSLLVAVEGGLEPGIDLSDLQKLLSVEEVGVEADCYQTKFVVTTKLDRIS